MRIISGNLKGKKISLPKDKATRPLKDMVKESIFNLIEHSKKFNVEVNNSNVLDLFSGSGSFGLECISRGCKNVDFVENHEKALLVLKENISKLKVEKNCNVINKNCFDFLNLNKYFSKKYNIIFIDPPFKEKKINEIIYKIKELNILFKDGIIIIHRHKKDDLVISKNFYSIEIRKYGISKIIFGV